MPPARTLPLVRTCAASNPDAKAARRITRLLNPMPVFRAYLPSDPKRPQVEDYIAARFRDVHGANVHQFMPVLLTMGCHGFTTAAAGIRVGASQPLFLEQYLSVPVEEAIAGSFGATVSRARIAEIGNLVATERGSSYLLFLVLSGLLEQAGFDYVVFTATPQVQKVLAYLGLAVHVLCTADPGRLTGSAAAEWGSYYASRPKVVAGKVADGMAALRLRMLYSDILSLFREQVADLVDVLVRESGQRGSCILAA